MRTRLKQKLPPELPSKPVLQLPSQARQPVLRRVLECTDCGRPGQPEALPGGLCRDCRTDSPQPASGRPTACELRTRVAALRDALRGGQLTTPATG